MTDRGASFSSLRVVALVVAMGLSSTGTAPAAPSPAGGVKGAHASGLPQPPPALTIVPAPNPNTSAQFGYALQAIDLDGNGVIDVLSGAREAHAPTMSNAGRAYRFAGATTTPAQTFDDPEPQTLAEFGVSISTGDLNGDGWLDLAIGAREFVLPGVGRAGKVVVFYGPTHTLTKTIFSPTPLMDARFGHWTACGDFDGDGFADLAVGAIGMDVGGVDQVGEVYVYFGPSLGPVRVLPNPLPSFNNRFGYRMVAEDFDRDGFCDLAVAAPFKALMPAGTDNSGALWVFGGPFFDMRRFYPNPHPSTDGLLGSDMVAADLDNDGWRDLVIGAELDNSGGVTGQGSVHVLYGPAFTNNAIVYHPNPSVSAGFGSAVAAGDFNGDSVPDLFVGEFWFPANGVNRAGRAHVLLGPAYTQAVTFQEPAPGSSNEFGRRVVAADLNGNGRAEIVVGVPSSSRGGGIRAGALYIGSP